MYGLIKRSHSIHMLNIQIDTKSLELVIYHQFNNIKLPFFASHMKSSFPPCTVNRCFTVIRYSRVAVSPVFLVSVMMIPLTSQMMMQSITLASLGSLLGFMSFWGNEWTFFLVCLSHVGRGHPKKASTEDKRKCQWSSP